MIVKSTKLQERKVNLSKFKRIKINSFKLKFIKEQFENLPIRKKLFYSFMLISFIGIFSGLIGLTFIQKTTSDYNSALINYGFSQGDIGKLGIEIEKSNSLVRDTLFLTDANEQKDAKNSLNKSLDEIEGLLNTVTKSITSNEEKEILNRIKINLAAYKQIRTTVVVKGLANDKESGLKIFKSDGTVLMNKISSDISLLLQTKIDTCNLLSTKLNILKFVSITIVIASMIGSLILGIFLAKNITKSISNPIDHMKNVASEMANGNLEVSIDISSNDEIGALASSFSQMITTLKNYINEISTVLGSISNGNFNIHIVEDYKGNFVQIKSSLDNIVHSLSNVFLEIKDATTQVNNGASQVASTSQIISEGATDQANSIEELSTSIEKFHEQLQLTVTNADNTNLITMNLVKDIQNSNTKMNEMLSAMNYIEKSSKDINNIIKAITDIATETNLLALNAAIEAARAGEAGKGFSVVADEVRKLSFQSSDAAKQTSLLINDSINAVNQGKTLANNTAQTLLELVTSVNNVSGIISNITAVSKDQADSISQIHHGILKISDVVQSNSAIAEESAASSQELTAQAETLNIMIDQFKLKS
ncbi:methyl-accepting chemotaxis protein [Clostridium chromiireducens]|uniref:Methyl-accepting chemotaxis protein n=1 Tax=Clostridium chromiireducens TaxID=225345 RepID=A0A399ITV8_9CLOT|nr:methyl-accepting chemotaxis protein [Clostridium chromiireducens]RII36473.1 methyl-accepting chemotaxis protein [Clostridium chromiireducens]